MANSIGLTTVSSVVLLSEAPTKTARKAPPAPPLGPLPPPLLHQAPLADVIPKTPPKASRSAEVAAPKAVPGVPRAFILQPEMLSFVWKIQDFGESPRSLLEVFQQLPNRSWL